MAQGSAARGRRDGAMVSLTLASSTRMGLSFTGRLRFRGLLRADFVALDMAAEAEAHGGEQLLAEGVFLARAKAREQRRRQNLGGHGLFDGGFDGPAAFAGVLDVA